MTDHQPGQLVFSVEGGVDPDFGDFVNALCHPKESARLGAGRDGPGAVSRHIGHGFRSRVCRASQPRDLATCTLPTPPEGAARPSAQTLPRLALPQVRAHAWFSNIEWTTDELQKGAAASPFVAGGALTKRLQDLAAGDDGGAGSSRLIERLGAVGEPPPDQALFEAFGTMHPKLGTGFSAAAEIVARRRSLAVG